MGSKTVHTRILAKDYLPAIFHCENSVTDR